MAQQVQKVEETVVENGVPTQSARQVTTDTSPGVVATPTDKSTTERIVYYIAGVLLTLLAFRFVLSLLGADRDNGFADFIYSVSYPFVAPFFGLFGYEMEYGRARFEIETLVAMAVYAIVAYGIAKLIRIARKEA
jgi:hypothetical protein